MTRIRPGAKPVSDSDGNFCQYDPRERMGSNAQMSTLLEEFKLITRALNDAGIDYAVCGGWAMAIHGLPRATIDIDLLILGDDLGRAWDLAKQHGYDVEGLPFHFGVI